MLHFQLPHRALEILASQGLGERERETEEPRYKKKYSYIVLPCSKKSFYAS